ncbi:MAG: DDE-type integrase/transposase/recombinase [Silicimonas sp.]
MRRRVHDSILRLRLSDRCSPQCRNVIDHEGEVLKSFVTKSRDNKAALKFLKTAMRKHGRPEAIVTDKLRSGGVALR